MSKITPIEVSQGSRPVTVIKSSVIGLIGTAPMGDVNTPVMVLSEAQAAQFGQQIPGFTIPQALAAIFAQGPATVIVVNVFDSVDNLVEVALEAKSITNGKLKLSAAPIGAVSIFLTNGTTPFTGVKDVDYTLDAFGNFTALSATASEGLALKFTFKKLDTGTVTSSQIIGGNVSGVREGISCLELVNGLFGFKPKILISPVYIELPAVAAALLAVAPKYRAITLPDAPVGTTIAGAIASRGPAATSNFKTASQRAYLLFPHLKAYDGATDSDIVVPYSAYMAGLIAKVDREEGYWVSPSNHEIAGVVGTEIPIVADYTDENSETNVLNAAGITTVYTGYGTGIRSWGNRSAAYPTDTTAKNFLSIRRMADVVHESLEGAAFPFIDKPLNQATADAIRETGNGFFRTLIGRGACLPGSRVEYIPADNPAEELAAGHIQFNLVFMGPTPAERITFQSILDINLLTTIV
jgi:phage tail sheath protein FI